MKILHIIFSFNTGGSETMLVDILNDQATTEHVELMIVNKSYSKELIKTIDGKITIHYLNRSPGSINPIHILKLNYKISNIKPDVIHFHNHKGIRLLGFRSKFTTCLTVHTVNVPLVNLSIYNKLFSISNSVKQNILKRGGPDSIVNYNGIDFYQFESREKGIVNPLFKIVQVSRLDHKIKGQDILIKAVSTLIKERGINNIQLDLIGEGPSLGYLEDLVKQLGIESYVNFLGSKTRKFIYKDLKNYHLLVQPSLYEGFGLTVVEGMAAKIPVLVSDIEGPMEIIKNGKYGDHFEKGNIVNAANRIESIINRETNKKQFTIEKAYRFATEQFNIKKTSSNYVAEYRTL